MAQGERAGYLHSNVKKMKKKAVDKAKEEISR
jgi:hypothetical protein